MAANPFSDPEFGADAAKGAKPASKKNPFSDPEFGKEPKRTWGEAAKDTGAAVMGGLAGLVKTGGDLYGLASGNMDNAASELGRNAQEYWSDAKSQALQTKIAQRKANIDAQESTLGKAWTAVKDTLTDPALAADTVAENVATMLPGAGVGRAVGAAKYARGFQAASEFGPASLAAREAIAKQAGKYATGAAIGTGAVQQGADVSGDIYGDLMKKTDAEWDASPDFQAALQRHGGDRQAAKSELANATARAAFLPTAGISVAANAIPGATYLERALVGAPLRTGAKEVGRFGAARGFARGVLGEGGQEFVEEGGGRLGANLAAQQQAMPGHDTWDGVGENAGMGFAGGALLGVGGGVHGAREAMAQKRAQDAAKGAEDGGTLGTPAADTPPADVPPGDGQAGPGGGLGAPTGAGADMAGMLAPANPLLEAMNQRAADPSAIAPPIDDGKIFDKSAAAPVAGELYQPGDTTNPLTGERITAKPSEAMGINPADGPLSTGAALAVDTGVSEQMQQAAALAEAVKAAPKTPAGEAKTAAPDLSGWSDQQLSDTFRAAQAPDVRRQLAVELSRRRDVREQQALRQEMDAEQAAMDMQDAPDDAFANVREDAGAPNLQDGPSHSVADGVADKGRQPTVSQQPKEASSGTQAQETQQAGAGQQEARAGQAGARDESHLNALELRLSHERGRLRAAKTDAERATRQVTVDGIEREIAGERKFLGLAPQAASAMSDDALMQALKPDGAEKTSTAQPPLSGTISPQPQAAGPALAAPEFTTIKTVHGDSVTVRTSDLQGDAPRLRQYTKAGKAKAVPAIHRDNLDLTGEKSAERAKENAKNLLFHTVTTKDGGAFASQAAAQREVNRLGLQDSHEVVEAGGGFVGRIKKTGEQHGATARNLRLADERTPGAGAAAPHGPGESVAGEAPVVGAGQRQTGDAGRLDGATTEQPVSSLFTGKPDPINSAPLRELDGFKVGDAVDVPGRTIGRSTVEALFRQAAPGLGMVDMARVVGADGKKLDVLVGELRSTQPVAQAAESVTAAANEAATSPHNDLPEPVKAALTEDQAVADLRRQLREVEDKIMAAAPASMAKGGGDIEAAMKSSKVPVTLKAQRKKIKDELRKAQHGSSSKAVQDFIDGKRDTAPTIEEVNAGTHDKAVSEGAEAKHSILAGKAPGDTLNAEDGSLYRVLNTSSDGKLVRLTQNPDQLSERVVLMNQERYQRLLAEHAAVKAVATEKPIPAEQPAKPTPTKSKPDRPQPGDPGYTLLDARNDLIDLRTQVANEGPVGDDRMHERMRRQEKLVRDMEADSKPAAGTDPAPQSQTVKIPAAIDEALTADMHKQQARVKRLRTQAESTELDLEGKKAAQLKVTAAETTLRKMRLARFDAEDAAAASIKAGVFGGFIEHADLFPQAAEALRQHLQGAQQAPANNEPATRPVAYGAKNTLVSQSRADELRAKLREKAKNHVFGGLDTEMMAWGTELAVFHLEAGVRKFADLVAAMASDLGTTPAKLKPYLRSWYNGARDMMEDHGLSIEGMDSPETVRAELVKIGSDAAQESKAKTAAPSLSESLLSAIRAGNMPKDNPALKKLVEAFDGKPADPARMKEAQEQLEAAIVAASREVVAKGEGDKSTFDALLRLYESQPNLNVRTSTSIANQAYSTPAPLAFLASQLAGITKQTLTHEPTAGTGMLLIGAEPKNSVVNELNDLRVSLLEQQGFTPTQKDAATEPLRDKRGPVDAVITNPPFGSIKDENGKATKVKVDGYNLGQIDHLIAARALETMKDDGRATLILGANKAPGGLSTDDRIFFNWLYSHYNVVGHFEVAGDLYARQGAGWPVRVIAIAGREKSSRISPVAGTIERVDNWSQVYDQYKQLLDSSGRPVRSAGAAAGRPVEGQTQPADVPDAAGPETAKSDRPGRTERAGGNGNVAGARAGAVADLTGATTDPVGHEPDEQRLNAQSYVPPRLGETGQGAKPAPAQRPAKPAGTAAVADAPAEAGNEFQSSYIARSARKDDGVLIPSNMAQPTQDALNRLEDQVGDIDEFARKELGYESTEALHNALMGLQVDSVATAIYQIKQNKAVVIADQTGIGKGRQAASIIRWAARNGMTPVFVSVKPSLFTDMYGDLADIGTHDVAPFILNSTEWVSGADGEKLFANKPSTHRAAIQSIVDNAALPQGRNALFMTYSQINTANLQRQALMALAPNAVFVLDESHNAAGDSGTGDFMISVLKEARGVTYLSATYAKRPDNMPLYFKTDIGDAAADSEGLADAMAAGGLPLQTVVSNNLVKAGQMFRRERSYDGVSIASTFDTANRQLHERLSDEATEALRSIVSADKLFHSVFVKTMDKALKAEGSKVQDNAGNQVSAGVQHTEFSSVVHNFVRQMLLGLKAQTAADEAIASLKRGEKPIIAVENTMGSFLSEYAAQNNINQGDSLGAFDYRTVLSRALERSRVINVVLPTGDKSKQNIPLSQLDPITRKAYDQAQEVIDRLAIDIPVSPIDWMRAEIARAGFSVAEITGRDLAVDYSNPRKPVLSAIDLTEQRDKVASTRRFNGGELDALILNVAGSTGISLHASEKFADQRQRHMIVAQAAGDINIFMQMLGRVHRTGQVRLPKYTILSVDLPTEKRPTAVLSRKMKSLNANTSSNTESATSVKTADILNKYGDQIVNQYLVDNLALANQLDVDDLLSSDGERVADDIARKATGRLALQPIEVQRAFYEDVEAQYDALIEYLNKTNQNDLEPRTFDFDAKEVRAEILFDGPNKTTPFGEDAVYGEYSIKAQGMAMKPEEIQAAIAEGLQGKTPAEHVSEMLANLDSQYKQFIEKLAEASREKAAVANADGEYDNTKHEAIGDTLFINKSIESAGLARQMGADFLRSHAIGKTFRVEINSEPYNAVITNVRSTHKTAGNPFSLSKFQITLAVNGALRSITVPATQFRKIEVSSIAPAFRIETLFKEQSANQRETAKIVTGNLLAAYGEIKGVRGTIISFTKADGTIEQGILLPKLFDFSKNTQGDYRLRSGADALKFLQKSTNKDIGRFGIATRDGQVRVLPRGDGVQVRVPKSKAQGARYFLDKNLIAVAGDFVSSANAMVANVDDAASAKKVLDMLMDKQALYALPSMADEAKSMAAKPGADGGTASFSRATDTKAAIGTPAATIRAAITKAYGKLLGQLESKGLVTLTQTEDEAIEAAAQARADKTGQPLAEVRASLMGSVSNSVATDTPAFKRWFGDSKVVDADGKPLRVYHGTRHSFDAFKREGRNGRNRLHYFSADPAVASEYAGSPRYGDPNVMPAYVSLQKPFTFDAGGEQWGSLPLDLFPVEISQHFDERNILRGRTGQAPRIGFTDVIRGAIAAGYDGVIADQIRDGGGPYGEQNPSKVVVAAKPEQIKSAIGNNGNFDPADGRIDHFGANRPAKDGTPTDRAVMDMTREGKSAQDILRLIAGTSKSRFNRQVARLLLRTGVTPKVEALAADGLGKDKRGFNLLAKYSRDSNTISLTEGAGYMAEQIMLHELIHAATLRALDRKGLASLQMRRLFEHVQKHGGLAGTYGMKNVGEFTSEAFTNPEFQRALRQIAAPPGGRIKAAWDGFVRILRSILGLPQSEHSALSQALELGVAVMREDMALRQRGVVARGRDAQAGIDQTQTEAFKRWFKDSKVVDAEGKPLVVYRGGPTEDWQSGAEITEFRSSNGPWAGFFTNSSEVASRFANAQYALTRHGGKPAGVFPVYLSMQKPLEVDAGGKPARDFQIDASVLGKQDHPLRERMLSGDYDGLILRNTEDEGDVFVPLNPNQIKSAIGNNGNFDPEDADIAHFGAAELRGLKDNALDRINTVMSHPGKVSLWDKTVGTMRNLAERAPAFKPVFEAAQRFIDDVALLANDAADMAPRVLPRVDTWRDLAKKPISAADNKAVAKPLFEGTLLWARDANDKPVLVSDLEKRYANLPAEDKAQMMLKLGKLDAGVLRMWQGLPLEQFEALVESRFESQMLKAGVVWTDKELADIFKATPHQIGLYRETRKAIDRSIDMTARADMLRVLGEDFAGLRDAVLEQDSLGDAMEFLISELTERQRANPDDSRRLTELHHSIVDRAERARDLMDKGYAPLSRFGRYTVDVVDASGERQYFGMYESKADSNRAAMQMRAAFPGATVTQGTMSQEAYKLFAGITPESLELFGNMLGLDEEGGDARDKVFQEYLKLTKNNHSALKRLIHRQGIAGFSEDVGRVLAAFVYSNARQSAGALNAGTIDKAVNAIPKEQGELKDVAMGLRNYIRDPQEEGQAVRGMLFAQYLGGSVASAFVNMTQPFAVTIPWLSQYGGIKSAGAHLAKALKDMGTKGFKYEADLAAALKHAEDDGVVSPQEIHQLMAQARGSGSLRSGDGTRVGEARAAAANAWERTKVAWGQPFALAEQFNRRSTFIAAYRIAKEQKMADPAAFARRAVEETQFVYSKAAKSRWMRGAIGGTLMTFKSYSIQYLELLHRMWTQGGPEGKRAVGWAMVMLMLAGGAGGLPFMEDLEDLIDGIAQLMGYNVSSKQWRQRALRDVLGKELAEFMEQGVSGLPGAPVDVSGRLGLGNLIPGTGLLLQKPNRERDLLEIAGPAGDLIKRGFTGGRKLLTGDVGGAALEVSPTAVRNAAKGADMAASGMYKDAKGYKVIDTTLGEALAKAGGFQPRSVAQVQEANSFMMRSRSFYQQNSAEIKAQWADALFRKDEAALERVRERLAAWNRDNPDQRMVVKMPDVWKRVREMGKDRTQRIADTAPKALRQQMREMARENG